MKRRQFASPLPILRPRVSARMLRQLQTAALLHPSRPHHTKTTDKQRHYWILWRSRPCHAVIPPGVGRPPPQSQSLTSTRHPMTTLSDRLTGRKHLPALDGLRGVAILAVMVLHFSALGHWVPATSVDRFVAALASGGWIGVDLFFVLSGFLITGILRDNRGQPHYFQNFYARRALRIFPLYYGALVVYFVVLPTAAPHHEAVEKLTRGAGWYWSYLANVQIAVGGWGATSSFVDHFWSLAVEEQFYLVWPFLVFMLSRRAMLRLCVVMVASALLVRTALFANDAAMAAYVLTPSRMDALAVGAMISLAARDGKSFPVLARAARPVLGLAVAVVAAVWWIQGGPSVAEPLMGTVGLTALSLVFGSLLVLTLASPESAALSRGLRSRPLRVLGRYSYALYVVHAPVALLLPSIGISAAVLPPLFGLTLPGQLAFTGVACIVSLGAAYLSWHLFEKHFLKLKDRFAEAPARAAVSGPAHVGAPSLPVAAAGD